MALGGFRVDIDLDNGKLKLVRIFSINGNPLKLSYSGKVIEVENTEKGKVYLLGENAERII